MTSVSTDQLTATVLRTFEQTPSPRLKEVMTSLVAHLHAFVAEVGLTEQEWSEGIGFLTQTGQMSDDKRQEFILLSDALGVSMLVDLIAQRKPAGATETTVLGPFYISGAPDIEQGGSIARVEDGAPLVFSGRVLDQGGGPIAGAVLDIWQASPKGLYDVQDPEQPEYNLRGKLRTGPDGRYAFRTVQPHSYPIPDDGPVGAMLRATTRHPNRPAHVHFIITAEGFAPLTTHIFDAADPYLDSDAVFAVKPSLTCDFVRHDTPDPDAPGLPAPHYTANYDFVLTRVTDRAGVASGGA